MTIDMTFPLDNKIAIITGGASGIGRSIAERFAKEIGNGATAHQCDVSILHLRQQLSP